MNSIADNLIKTLKLTTHEEGGYYKETFRSDVLLRTDRPENEGIRCLATSIYYMLTATSPIGFFHKNESPILHFYHSGGAMIYRLIHPDGSTEEHILGPEVSKGHCLQFLAPGGCWKSTELESGSEYGLVSEVVFPGWELFDSVIADKNELLAAFPQHAKWIEQFSLKEK